MTQLFAVIIIAVGFAVIVFLSRIIVEALLHWHTLLWLWWTYNRRAGISMDVLRAEAFIPPDVQSGGATPVGVVFVLLTFPVLVPIMCFCLIGKSLSGQVETGKKRKQKRFTWLLDREKAIADSIEKGSDGGDLRLLQHCWRANCTSERIQIAYANGRPMYNTNLASVRADLHAAGAAAPRDPLLAKRISKLQQRAEAIIGKLPEDAVKDPPKRSSV